MQDPRAARAASVDTGDVYERVREDFVATVSALSDDELTLPVPATPSWSVRDVLAHVVGLAADLNAQPDYRQHLARVLTRRALENAIGV